MTTNYNAGLDSSNVLVSYAVESAWATIPTTVFQSLRVTAEDFTSDKDRVRPLEINPSGYAQHAITTKITSKGSFNYAFSFGTFDAFILGALNAASWSNFEQIVGTGDLSIVTPNEVTSTTTSKFAGLYAGQKVTLAGFTNYANNGDFVVVSVTSGASPVLTLTVPAGVTLVAETAPSGATISAISIVGVAGDITITTGTNVLSSTTSGKFSGVIAGQWLRLEGFTNAANNGVFLVATFTDADHLVIQNSTDTQTFVTETPTGASVVIQGQYARNSNVVTTFSVEKQLSSALFLQYVGCYVSSWQMTMEVGKFVEGTFAFLVKSQISATSEAGTTTPAIAPTGRVIDNIGGFSAFSVNGAAPTAVLQSVEMTVSKQRSASQYGIGSAAAVGMRRGTLQVDGKLSLFFKDFTYYTDFVNEPDLGVSWQLTDNGGNAYVITLPAITIMNPQIVAKGIDQDIIADFSMEGNPAAATNVLYPLMTIQVDRLPV